MNDAIKQAEALRTLIRECVRFADWAAGQGIYPADGEPASVPEDFISDFLVRTDADGLGDFTDSVMALLPTAADLAGLAEGKAVVVPVERIDNIKVVERVYGGASEVTLVFAGIASAVAFRDALCARLDAKEEQNDE